MRCHFTATRMSKIKNSSLCVLIHKMEGFLTHHYKVLVYELLLHKTNDESNQYPKDESHNSSHTMICSLFIGEVQ